MSRSKAASLGQLVIALGCVLQLASCDALPSGGPRPSTFEDNAHWQYLSEPADENGKDAFPFVLVNVDRKVISTLSTTEDSAYFKGAFTDRTPPTDVVLGVGDVVRITIYEAGPGGLFVPANGSSNGNSITLPDQEVDAAGRISVPYAGKDGESGFVQAQGRKLSDVQQDILKRLANKAIEPQVIVTMVKRTSNMFSIMGDVHSPGRFNLDQGGVHVLDALSQAGGPVDNDYNTLVTLQRGTVSATARLSTILTQNENNIYMQPGDLLAVKKDERYYNVLGATHTNNRLAFEAEKVTVADALAKSGGLDNQEAEPKTVVVFRREPLATLETMGVDLTGNTTTEPMPTVYRLDFSQPSGMFYAQKMELHDGDVVYVSTHPFADAVKLLDALRDVFLIDLIRNN